MPGRASSHWAALAFLAGAMLVSSPAAGASDHPYARTIGKPIVVFGPAGLSGKTEGHYFDVYVRFNRRLPKVGEGHETAEFRIAGAPVSTAVGRIVQTKSYCYSNESQSSVASGPASLRHPREGARVRITIIFGNGSTPLVTYAHLRRDTHTTDRVEGQHYLTELGC